jgi:hypothetical protein
MTVPASVASLNALTSAAVAAGVTVTSSASWPESDSDGEVPALAGFIDSAFSPLVAEVVARTLRGRDPSDRASGNRDAADRVTAVVVVTALGDVTSATRVAAVVDAGRRVPPLQFFQSVPNSVVGHLAARWHLTGPVACVTGTAAGLDMAAQLIEDADADEALVVRVDLKVTDGDRDRAAAVLVTGPADRERPGAAGT